MDPVISPYQLLIDYAWAILKANTPMLEIDYEGLVPIVPLTEEPEIIDAAGGKPYLVYGYSLDGTQPLPAQRRGAMTFVVYSSDFRDITRVVNVLNEGFGRSDESARDINRWTSTLPHFVGLRFGTVQVAFAEGGAPEDEEGGNQSGIVSINFEYYIDYTIITNLVPYTP